MYYGNYRAYGRLVCGGICWSSGVMVCGGGMHVIAAVLGLRGSEVTGGEDTEASVICGLSHCSRLGLGTSGGFGCCSAGAMGCWVLCLGLGGGMVAKV